MALTNATGFKEWQQFDQIKAATSVPKFADMFNNTTFMKTGTMPFYGPFSDALLRALQLL